MISYRRSRNRALLVYLLINTLVSGSVIPLMAGASEVADRVLLCTSSGYQWVQIGGDESVAKDVRHCIYCLTGSDSEEPDFIQSALGQYIAHAESRPSPASSSAQGRRFYSNSTPRAPPVNL